jgi:DNA replication and repair protein RecF
MYLKSLTLVNFKNYADAALQFSSGVNCFTGNNGTGKTNILDAVHYLSLTKSYFNASDAQNIKHGEQMFVVQGTFEHKESVDEIFCGLKTGNKKQLKRNAKEYSRMSNHIGLFPVVMIAPVDHILIAEGSEERRKFIDSIISQVDKQYLDDLIAYNRTVAHRNAFLKLSSGKELDITLLHVWNEQMIQYGKNIFEKRKQFIETFIPMFTRNYKFLCDNDEQVSIAYQSQLFADDFVTLLNKSLQKDLAMQFSTTGIHKDDLVFNLGEQQLKRIASQGQQKTFLVALKIAQFEYLQTTKNVKPILLLDDIFDKLDDNRVQRLMELVSKEKFGQIFITDTHPERLKQIFEGIHVAIKCFNVSRGEVKLEKEVEA